MIKRWRLCREHKKGLLIYFFLFILRVPYENYSYTLTLILNNYIFSTLQNNYEVVDGSIEKPSGENSDLLNCWM